ncbi:MAG TPA: hypothetical protein ENK45_03760 [Aliiroseovarius sp.]|nr:hypothetical protein [Aliiroseovarius sp.]
MVSRLAGAVLRAVFVVLLIVTPALMVPGTGPDTRQIVALFAFLAAGMVIFEYSSDYPGLVEFRYAPPFNRIRFVSLFVTVFMLSVVVRGPDGASDLARLIQAVGARIGEAMDFPYSPVNLVVLMLPPDASADQVALLRTGAGISYLVSLLSLAAFLFTLKALNWPYNRQGVFNVWINLPTFDPTGGGDVVYRLERDASINIAIGFLLPFLTPAVVKAADSIFWSISITNTHTIVWTLAAWAFLPAGLFMRGIAMGRIASMVKAERARRERLGEEGGYQPI